MDAPIQDAEFRETTGSALAPVASSPLAQSDRLDREAIVAKHEDFEWLKARFLDRTKHIYVAGGKDRVNSAGWEHLAMCLNISLTFPLGAPKRELLDAANGKKIISFAAFVRAERGDRTVERPGRCDSTEAKHNQYEHKMEQVASTRASNRAICILVGGADSDVGDEDDPPARAEPVERVPVSQLKALAQGAGITDLRTYLAGNIATCGDYAQPDCARPLTPKESVLAAAMLRSLISDANITQEQMARIHILAKEAGLEDRDYRALLLRVAHKPSSTQLTRAEADAVIREMLTLQERPA